MKKQMPTQVSKNVVNKPVITGKPGRGINPAAVAQLGGVYGSHITDRRSTNYAGEKWLEGKRPVEQEMGNTIAAKTVCGVGGSRTVNALRQSGTVFAGPQSRRQWPKLRREATGPMTSSNNPRKEMTMCPDIRYKGPSPEARIAARQKNSGGELKADVRTVHGTGPTRTHTNIMHSGTAHGSNTKQPSANDEGPMKFKQGRK